MFSNIFEHKNILFKDVLLYQCIQTTDIVPLNYLQVHNNLGNKTMLYIINDAIILFSMHFYCDCFDKILWLQTDIQMTQSYDIQTDGIDEILYEYKILRENIIYLQMRYSCIYVCPLKHVNYKI